MPLCSNVNSIRVLHICERVDREAEDLRWRCGDKDFAAVGRLAEQLTSLEELALTSTRDNVIGDFAGGIAPALQRCINLRKLTLIGGHPAVTDWPRVDAAAAQLRDALPAIQVMVENRYAGRA